MFPWLKFVYLVFQHVQAGVQLVKLVSWFLHSDQTTSANTPLTIKPDQWKPAWWVDKTRKPSVASLVDHFRCEAIFPQIYCKYADVQKNIPSLQPS